MKKRKVLIMIVFIFVLAVSSVFMGACKPGVLTFDSLKTGVERYEITLPESVTFESHAADIAMGDAEYLAILNYDGSDEEFNALFVNEGDCEEYDHDFDPERYKDMPTVTENFAIPEKGNKYRWLSRAHCLSLGAHDGSYDRTQDTGVHDELRIYYFYELNLLAIYEFDL